ncbi:GNAT family N-acetyltransferase [Spiractinospora alimapuensis]|uniref:GNAT family N-acetyltransferase n=1 Tax=Spiractinospora alimapuensis TaxID=2820884 RepID=UPI001F1C7C0C|nr:GNAT family N-acetyltransferase [Spiractinospora alimapuensis]QVQ52704.1 GNAT family N-acetyltransferase [Spiractinospora alimapuensis]
MADSRISEIPVGETHRAHRAIRELRPELTDVDAFVTLVDEKLRPGGYHLVGSFDERVSDDAVAVAGFRIIHSLWGRFMYVDDLVTHPDVRGTGQGRALLDWLRAEARAVGCTQFHLDSGTQRHGAHRFYLSHGMAIRAFHFIQDLDS